MDQTIKQVGNKCFGCGACAQSCPQDSIVMEYNPEGFLYPTVEDSTCVNCGLCLQLCPVFDTAFAPETAMPRCYAAYSDDDLAMQSSSGGVFSVLSERVLESGGFVCGAAFDEKWLVAHEVVSDKTGLARLKTSKYLQSDTRNVYSEIKALLEKNRPILFSGTPCQVGGLYGFLGKDYDQLYTVDVFCHGVPSPKVWETYLHEVTGRGDIESVCFRDKTRNARSGEGGNTTIRWVKRLPPTKDQECVTLSENLSENVFIRGFLRNLYLRKSCSVCKYSTTPRRSDISLGDFWSFDRLDKNRDTRKGISAVLLNTLKGIELFNQSISELKYLRSVALDSIVFGNLALKEPFLPHENRDEFMSEFSDIGDNSICDLIEKHLGDKNVGILNFAPFSVHNYGAVLVAYAMERAVARLGYRPSTINFVPERMLFIATADNVFAKFRKNFLNLTGICTDKRGLSEQVNPRFNRLCIGSDQVVRAEWHSDFIYYLDWAGGRKALISYAASFGMPDLGMNAEDRAYAKQCLQRFDAFSVREHSGASIMERLFGRECPVVCDPTMLLDASDFQPIIDAEASVQLPKDYVAYYFLHESPEILSNLKQSYPLVDAYKDEAGGYRSVGDWLNILKNAKYVMTDSFHGSVFSILYRKQFLVLPTKSGGNDRLTTLMASLGQDRFIVGGSAITEELFENEIDYQEAEIPIMRMRADGFSYLESALAIKPKERTPLFNPNKSGYITIFGFLKILKIRPKKGRVYIRLLGFIPLLKIKRNNIYLFNIIKIARLRGV